MNEDILMMWLSRSLNLSLTKCYGLLKFFATATEIFYADKELLLKTGVINSEGVDALEKGKKKIDFWVEELYKHNINFISVNNKAYPSLLKTINYPPVGLYYKGKIPSDNKIFVSVIGARRCSEYGKTMAHKIAGSLAKEEIVVVSGLALGIDTIAHIGSLDKKGITVAVLGFGHNQCYPANNRILLNKINETGCSISEYPPNYPSSRYTFPQRNRIIAGISEGLIVVEAGLKSGTLITVDFALEYGRTVMTIPTNITNKFGSGTNDLIKQGCPIVTTTEDILFELGVSKKKKLEEAESSTLVTLTEEERNIYNIISYEPISIEKISSKINISIQDLQYILTMLELSSVIEKLPGERYIRTL